MYPTRFRTAAGAAAAPVSNYANDRAEIENLQARYLFALDFNDGEAYADVFAPDGRLDWAGGVILGRDQILKETQEMRDRFGTGTHKEKPVLRHFITNNVIEVRGDIAYGRAYWFEFYNDVPEGQPPIAQAYGSSEDEYRKIDGKWYFTMRKIKNEMMSDRLAGDVNPIRDLDRLAQ